MDLLPGFYWAELTMDRPADEATVLAALRDMGFTEAVIEHRDAPPGYGGRFKTAGMFNDTYQATTGTPLKSNTYTKAPTLAETTPTATKPVGTAVSQTTASVAYAPKLATVDPNASAPKINPNDPMKPPATAPAPARAPAPAPTPAPAASPAPAPAASTAPVAEEPYAPYGYEGGMAPAPEPDDDAPVYSRAPAAPPASYARPAPTYAPAYAPSPSPSLQMSASPPRPDGAVYQPPPPPPQGCISVGPGMFICPPNIRVGARMGGVRSVWRFPFVARLDRAITISDRGGIRWSRVHQLPFDPFASMTFRVFPWTLDSGNVYAMRFMSRDRSVRTKPDVARVLHSMGFDPVSLFLVKRNVRIPGRTASCSEWIAYGKWTGPATVVTTDDPFYFAEARSIT